MFTATRLQAVTYLFGICLFSISFLVFLNSSVSFVITDLIKERKGVGNAVGTLGFADELVALIACPVWGALSDRIGVRLVAVMGYSIVGLALILFVQARNVFPELLLARLFFSIGGAATATMVTAILPSMTASPLGSQSTENTRHSELIYRHAESPSISSELTITPARLHAPVKTDLQNVEPSPAASPTRLAGLVGVFTGLGALLALGVFLPLPARFQKLQYNAGEAVTYTYYIVGLVALLVAAYCALGLRKLNGEEQKSWADIISLRKQAASPSKVYPKLAYWRLLYKSIQLGYQHPLIGLGYLGGFVARASSVGISLFIPLYVNTYFISAGLCDSKPIDDPTQIKSRCPEAYVLAAQLTGVSQLVALLLAPLFGYAADKYRRFHLPLLLAALVGMLGYIGLANLRSPLPSGASGSPIVFLVVSLLGISQIGCIVCSLGLLGRGILGLENEPNHIERSLLDSEPLQVENNVYEESDMLDETTGLLDPEPSIPDKSLNYLKGSIAGVYSLLGGAGILLLTKLGGFLFDKSPAAPFYMLTSFNALLFLVGVLSSSINIMRRRRAD
ncbi:MAG: hypothetical protein MMC33_009789 [Icmadophila ericetorum]|nr:hypothetical protein [Icmadophila ericetorum]